MISSSSVLGVSSSFFVVEEERALSRPGFHALGSDCNSFSGP